MKSGSLVARLQLVAVAILFSTGGSVVKLTALDGWEVACLRSLVAAVTLWLFMPGARRRWSRRALLVGCAYAGALIGFVLSSKLTTAANAVFLTGTAPLYVALLAPILLGERWQWRDLVYMAVMAVGMLFCLTDAQPRFVTAPDPALGNLVAISTGLFWALTVLGLRWLARDAGSDSEAPVAIVSGNVLAFLVCLPAALPFSPPTAQDVGIILFLGSIQIGLAYIIMAAAMRRVPALEASLILLVEPVLSALLAWAVHAEVPGPLAIVGALLILGATSAKALFAVRSERATPA